MVRKVWTRDMPSRLDTDPPIWYSILCASREMRTIHVYEMGGPFCSWPIVDNVCQQLYIFLNYSKNFAVTLEHCKN